MKWVALALALAGCAHARWDAAKDRMCFHGRCYRVGDLGPGWQKVEEQGAAVAFYNADLGAVISSNQTCRADADAAPLEALTRQLLIGYTDRQVRSQDRVELAGRGALHTVVDARLDGVPVTLELYVLKKNGCIFDLSLAAPPERFDDGRAELRRFVGGFADLRSS